MHMHYFTTCVLKMRILNTQHLSALTIIEKLFNIHIHIMSRMLKETQYKIIQPLYGLQKYHQSIFLVACFRLMLFSPKTLQY